MAVRVWQFLAIVLLATLHAGMVCGEHEHCETETCQDGEAGTLGAGKYQQREGESGGADSPTSVRHDRFASYPHKDIYKEYNKEGVASASKGDIVAGLKMFRAASLHSPFRGDVWSNIGLAYHDLFNRGHFDSSENKAKAALINSVAAFDLGHWLRNDQALSLRQRSHSSFKKRFPSARCPDFDCDRFEKEEEAMRLTMSGDHLKAVNLLCADEEYMTVSLTKPDWNGPITARTMRRMYVIMRVCGVIRIKDIFDKELMDGIHSQQKEDFEAFYQSLAEREQDSTSQEWTDAASRSDMRYEVKFPIKPPYTNPAFCANRVILQFIKTMLSDRIELDTFSTVTSLPGAPNQDWHGDVSFLFSRTVITDREHLPPQGLVVVLPLVPMTSETGPTEFMTGSHVNMGIDYWESKTTNPVTPLHRLEAEPGSAVIFDLRIRHRGTANKSQVRRPIVYMSYVHDWYSDVVNFKNRQTKEYDTLFGSSKKLFSRLDAQAYTAQLEEIVKRHGLDPKELQSDGNYKKVDLRA